MKAPFYVCAASTLLLAACGQNYEEQKKRVTDNSMQSFESAMTDSVMPDNTGMFIKQSSLKGQTANAVSLIEFAEKLSKQQKGYVESSSLNTQVVDSKEIQITEDSLLHLETLQRTAVIKLRVPYFALDSALLATAGLFTFVEERNNSNQWAEASIETQGLEYAATVETKKAVNQTHAKNQTEALRTQQETRKQEVQQLNTLMHLQHDIMYATLMLEATEPLSQRRSYSLLQAPIKPYEPNFFIKVWQALVVGAQLPVGLFLWLIKQWSLLLIAYLAWLGYKKVKAFGYLRS